MFYGGSVADANGNFSPRMLWDTERVHGPVLPGNRLARLTHRRHQAWVNARSPQQRRGGNCERREGL